MSFFTKFVNKYKKATPKQLILSGVFMLALAGAIGGGFLSRQATSAQEIRDCQYNSIDNKNVAGGCGALSVNELCLDMWTNLPGDLQTVYNEFGFQSADCDTERFQNTGRHGVLTTDGRLIVDGQTVMTNVWTMGRTTLGGSQRTPYVINGVTYYHSPTQVSLARDLDALVLFDGDGTVEFAALEACGNPITRGDKVPSGGECKELNKTPVDGKKNTYSFTTNATTFGFAKIQKYEYFYNEGNGEVKFAETSNGAQAVERTFEKSATVTVKVTIGLPGGGSKTVTSELCKKQVGVVKEEFLYVCEALIATAFDNNTRKFRFTTNTKQSNNVTADSADFTLDGDVTTKNVTTKDVDGNFYKDYEFDDTKTHTVSAIVNFTADGKKVTSKEGDCVAEVTPEVCIHNPELPPNHPKCKPPVEECVPQGKEDENCELPSTGPAGVAGLFAGVAAAGTVAHRMWVSRRNRA